MGRTHGMRVVDLDLHMQTVVLEQHGTRLRLIDVADELPRIHQPGVAAIFQHRAQLPHTRGICTDPGRDATRLCVVEDVADLWALERAGVFKGRYHVLGGTLSALDGVTPETLRIPELAARVRAEGVVEVILGTMLHGIGAGNMTPSWVRTVCVDINPATVTKLVDRGSAQASGIVTDVGLFLKLLADELAARRGS